VQGFLQGVISCQVPTKKHGGLLFFRSINGNTKTLSPILTSRSTSLPHTLILSRSHALSPSFTYNGLLTISSLFMLLPSMSNTYRGLLFFRSVNMSMMSVIATISHSSHFIIRYNRLFIFIVEYNRFSLLFFYSLEMSSSSLIASLLVFCIDYKVYKLVDDFPRNRNSVLYKTCKAYKVD
jgi:hypothetical protein